MFSYPLCRIPLLLCIKSESLLKARFGFCSLLCCVALGYVLPGRKALALSPVWCLGSALLLSQYFGNHLVETLNNYTFSLFNSQFMEETKKGTFPFISCRVVPFHLVTTTVQYFEHPRLIKMVALVCLENLFPAFPQVNRLLRNITRGCALRQRDGGWQGVWGNMGR